MQLAEGINREFHRRGNTIGVGHIGMRKDGFAAGRLNTANCLFTAGDGDVGDRYLGAFTSK